MCHVALGDIFLPLRLDPRVCLRAYDLNIFCFKHVNISLVLFVTYTSVWFCGSSAAPCCIKLGGKSDNEHNQLSSCLFDMLTTGALPQDELDIIVCVKPGTLQDITSNHYTTNNMLLCSLC